MTKRALRLCCTFILLSGLAHLAHAVSTAGDGPAPAGRVAILVDKSVLPEIEAGLKTYVGHIQSRFPVLLEIKADDWYAMKPDQVRAALKADWASKKAPRLVGAIMVGEIPVPLRGDPKGICGPVPLFYEDFDATWKDPDNDGVYEDPVQDPNTNATEIWTAWWVPPAKVGDRAAQTKLLKIWLAKLDRYYKGEITGHDDLLFAGGNVTSVEIVEGWWVLLQDAQKGLNQKLKILSTNCEDKNQPKPANGKAFTADELKTALLSQTWQHVHTVTHGRPDGVFWEDYAMSVLKADGDKPNPNWAWLDVSAFAGKGGIIHTTSGCGNGNFRGWEFAPHPENSLGNQLLFSGETPTIAYYGSATPQSTGPFAAYHTELVESLRADGPSYIAEGYFKMRNHDYAWGTTHYFFRGGDEKILSGDPFAKYSK